MPRLTVTLSDEHERILERQSDVGEAYRSKSEVVRECIEAFERVEELSNQLSCLETEVKMLREQREQLQAKAARVDELENQLRQLQLAYHTAIEEGRSPTELEPMVEEAEENPPAIDPSEPIDATAETTEATTRATEQHSADNGTAAPETVEATTTDHIEHAERPDTGTATADATAASEASQGTEPQAKSVPGTETRESTPTAETGQVTSSTEASRKDARTAERDRKSTATEVSGPTTREASGEPAGTGGVEIDEEQLYQTPGVGTRLKSALFGGPGGSR